MQAQAWLHINDHALWEQSESFSHHQKCENEIFYSKVIALFFPFRCDSNSDCVNADDNDDDIVDDYSICNNDNGSKSWNIYDSNGSGLKAWKSERVKESVSMCVSECVCVDVSKVVGSDDGMFLLWTHCNRLFWHFTGLQNNAFLFLLLLLLLLDWKEKLNNKNSLLSARTSKYPFLC